MDNAPKLRHFLFIESEYFWKKSMILNDGRRQFT